MKRQSERLLLSERALDVENAEGGEALCRCRRRNREIKSRPLTQASDVKRARHSLYPPVAAMYTNLDAAAFHASRENCASVFDDEEVDLVLEQG